MEVFYMFGRPPTEYVEYNPLKNIKKKIERKNNDDDNVDDLDKKKEQLMEEREHLLKKAEIRGMKKEVSSLRHPRYTGGKERAVKAGGRLLGFASGIVSEGIRSTRPRRVVRKSGVRRRQSMSYPGVYHPVSTDISLSRAIAVNNWSGESTGIMERDFFGGDNRERELLGDRNREVNIGSGFEQHFFGDKKNIDLISGTNKLDINSLTGKNKKNKETQYY